MIQDPTAPPVGFRFCLTSLNVACTFDNKAKTFIFQSEVPKPRSLHGSALTTGLSSFHMWL